MHRVHPLVSTCCHTTRICKIAHSSNSQVALTLLISTGVSTTYPHKKYSLRLHGNIQVSNKIQKSDTDIFLFVFRNVWPYYNHPTDMDLPVRPNHKSKGKGVAKLISLFKVLLQGPGAILSIADGYVVPYPVDDLLLDGASNDVPTIIGSTAQEIDCCTTRDLTHYTIPQYEQFINTRYTSLSLALSPLSLSFSLFLLLSHCHLPFISS